MSNRSIKVYYNSKYLSIYKLAYYTTPCIWVFYEGECINIECYNILIKIG